MISAALAFAAGFTLGAWLLLTAGSDDSGDGAAFGAAGRTIPRALGANDSAEPGDPPHRVSPPCRRSTPPPSRPGQERPGGPSVA